MIASLNLFIIDEISGSVSRVAIIYIGILHCLFLLSTMSKVGETSKRKCKFSENVRIKFPFFFSEGRNENEANSNIALYIYVKNPIFKMSCFFVESPAFSEKMSCFYNNPSGNPIHMQNILVQLNA